MSVSDLVDPIATDGSEFELPAAAWRQGRTLYGGASALIAYTAATRRYPDLPPLRAAQIGFVAPLGETMSARVEMVREGRNVIQLRSELMSDGQVALTAFWLFGTAREPNAVHAAPRADLWPGAPEDNEPVESDGGPAFIANNYELRRAQDVGGGGNPVIRRWVRLADRDGLDPVSRLVLLGDTLPPGAMRAMQRRGPLSSINWSFNLLDTRAQTRDGWWLAETASDHADDGYSSERLRFWNTDGKLVMSGLQAVAIFG